VIKDFATAIGPGFPPAKSSNFLRPPWPPLRLVGETISVNKQGLRRPRRTRERKTCAPHPPAATENTRPNRSVRATPRPPATHEGSSMASASGSLDASRYLPASAPTSAAESSTTDVKRIASSVKLVCNRPWATGPKSGRPAPSGRPQTPNQSGPRPIRWPRADRSSVRQRQSHPRRSRALQAIAQGAAWIRWLPIGELHPRRNPPATAVNCLRPGGLLRRAAAADTGRFRSSPASVVSRVATGFWLR